MVAVEGAREWRVAGVEGGGVGHRRRGAEAEGDEAEDEKEVKEGNRGDFEGKECRWDSGNGLAGRLWTREEGI